MRVLTRGAAIAFATVVSLDTQAADLSYPPPVVGQPQYGMAAPPAAAPPPQVFIVPGPAAPPQSPSAPIPPPPVGAYPYGTPPPIPPRADVVPPANCPPVWRCGVGGCGWQPGCVPPEHYSDQYDAPGQRYLGPRSPGPQVYVPPDAPPPPEHYPGPFSREGYPGPTGPYSR